jgi:hypothetical protein
MIDQPAVERLYPAPESIEIVMLLEPLDPHLRHATESPRTLGELDERGVAFGRGVQRLKEPVVGIRSKGDRVVRIDDLARPNDGLGEDELVMVVPAMAAASLSSASSSALSLNSRRRSLVFTWPPPYGRLNVRVAGCSTR